MSNQTIPPVLQGARKLAVKPPPAPSAVVPHSKETHDVRLPLTSVVELLEDADAAEVPYLWHPYVALGARTLLTGQPKAGKTELLSHVIAAMANGGGDIAGDIRPANVLVVSEEPRSLWRARARRLSIRQNLQLVFRFDVLNVRWLELVEQIAEAVQEHGFDVVVVDTFSYFAELKDENDAAQVTQAIKALDVLSELGVAVVLIHHKRKSEGAHGTGIRGSSAFAGCADMTLELDWAAGRRRRLSCVSRFEETPAALLELSADRLTYTAVGHDPAIRRAVIAGILAKALGSSPDQIRDQWPEQPPRPSPRTLDMDLAAGVKEGRWIVEGAGERGDPRRYSLAPGFAQTPTPRVQGALRESTGFPEESDSRNDA